LEGATVAVCKYAQVVAGFPNVDMSAAERQHAEDLGYQVSRSQIGNHRRGECVCDVEAPAPVSSESHRPDGTADYVTMSDRAWGFEDFRRFIASKGQDPDAVTFTWGVTSNPSGGFWNKLNNVKPIAGLGDNPEQGPEWPVIQQAAPVQVNIADQPAKPVRGMKLALKGADTQIGFRRLADGSLDPFHDAKAMDVFTRAAFKMQPDKIQILGDFLDLASQGRFAQEAAFANTTQEALDAGHKFLATLRAMCPDAEIVVIEGNHDKRMQNFIEANALAAFGLKRANMPESWPTMSLPYLLRLDELNIQYVDAYPAATDWDNDTTRNIHGTKANSKGSTTAQYVHQVPHLNTWAGHTHRVEITYHSVIGPRGEPIESYSANPGCLCRVDGAVPSVNGAIGADGTAARVVENWQQGFGLAYYNDTESWPAVYRIRNGVALIDGMELAA
jgi:hypothetical protein